MDSDLSSWRNEFLSRGRSSSLMTGQSELFPLEMTGIRPDPTRGGDLALIAEVGGDVFYCKRDRGRHLVRATEWFCTSLAGHLNIAVPDFAPIRNPETGEVFFGSKGVWGTASDFEVRTFLLTSPVVDKAIGGMPDWLGRHLSGLYVIDLFLGNPDRQMANFLLVKNGGYRRLLAFDFASCDLRSLGSAIFPIASSQTLSVGRLLRKRQGFHASNAIEMIDRIGAVPAAMIDAFLASMPADWMSDNERGEVSDLWSNGTVGERLDALRRGISDESLL